jgi:tetratricopeptide (TPR) repeat protein
MARFPVDNLLIASPARLLAALLAAGLLALPGCGTFRNAGAYFNTYYNASQVFDQAVAEMKKSPQVARDSNYFAAYKVPGPAVTKFEKVIEKGSKVIQFHGESGYVEDAIMMIGEAYLYQNETESAAGKFRELVENFPGSDNRPEASLWYAKALYQGKNDDQALTVAKELSTPATEGGGVDVPGDVLLEITMLEAQIYTDRGEYAQAAVTLDRINSIDGNGEMKAFAQFQRGVVYERTKEYAKAAEAYGMVGEYSPSPTMSFNAKLREGVMLSLAGEPESALDTFDGVISQPLKAEQSALVDLEIANAYWVLGDSTAAFTLYDIIDSTYKRTDAAAKSYYQRGDIMENHYRELSVARKYYELAKSEYPSSSITPLAAARFTSLEHFLKTQERLAADDSALQAMLAPRDSTTGMDSGLVAAGDSAHAASDTAGAPRKMFAPGVDPATKAAETVPKDVPAAPGRAELRPVPASMTENLSMRLIRSRPRNLVHDPEDTGEQTPGVEPGGAPVDPESALAGKIDAPAKAPSKSSSKSEPRKASNPEELRTRIAEGQYELGGIFLLDLHMPDSALVYYRTLVEESPGSPLVPKATYAMSEAYKLLGDSAAVDSLYDKILADHPETEYAAQVRKIRGLDTTKAVETDDAVRYRDAEAALFAGESAQALESFKTLSATSTDSAVAPKSRYAVGWIYENVLIDLDSADAWYQGLIKAYPGSVYASSAEPRVVVRADTSKLGQFVKYKKIDAIPKPQRKALGLVPKDATPGRLSPEGLPVDPTKPATNPDDDEYFNPGEDEDEKDADPDEEPDDEPDDDPGRLPDLHFHR